MDSGDFFSRPILKLSMGKSPEFLYFRKRNELGGGRMVVSGPIWVS